VCTLSRHTAAQRSAAQRSTAQRSAAQRSSAPPAHALRNCTTPHLKHTRRPQPPVGTTNCKPCNPCNPCAPGTLAPSTQRHASLVEPPTANPATPGPVALAHRRLLVAPRLLLLHVLHQRLNLGAGLQEKAGKGSVEYAGLQVCRRLSLKLGINRRSQARAHNCSKQPHDANHSCQLKQQQQPNSCIALPAAAAAAAQQQES